VTGFLGRGKTTLLSRILSEPSMSNTAVLVNEFGKVGLDHHLLRRAEERTVLLEHGCVCCTTRGDLVGALLELLDEEDKGEIPALERVVVETSGLADPASILFTVFTHPVLQYHYSVERVISTVDAVNGELHLDFNLESNKQVAAADVVVITKIDIAEPRTIGALRARIHDTNPSARITEALFGEAEPDVLLGPTPTLSLIRADGGVPGNGSAPHASKIHSTSLTFTGPVDWTAFGTWFSMLLNARGEDVLRVKGLLNVGEAGPVLLNGVQHVIHPPEHLEAWPDEDHRTRIVFITKGIRSEELLASLEAFRHIVGARPRLLEANAPV
jgi:G3E family GTPase